VSDRYDLNRTFPAWVCTVAYLHPELTVALLRAGREKYERTSFSVGGTLKVPLIEGSLAEIECLTSQVFVSGDHAIIVGVVEAARTRSGEPLLYFGGKFGCFAPLATAPS
jgi:flavin reductase ActVB